MRVSASLAVVPLIAAAHGVAAAQQRASDGEARGVSGLVLSADGVPVSTGAVRVEQIGSTIDMAIGSDGRFHVPQLGAGVYDVRVSVPGFMARQINVAVPRSGNMFLPPIRLTPATYVRMRLVSRSGQPVSGARVSFGSFDAMGRSLSKEPSDRPSDPSGDDGIVTIGPLPRGFTVMAVDGPQLARTRLTDVRVTGEKPLIDRGTVRVDRGATLNIVVVDEADQPVRGREVLLDDGADLA